MIFSEVASHAKNGSKTPFYYNSASPLFPVSFKFRVKKNSPFIVHVKWKEKSKIIFVKKWLLLHTHNRRIVHKLCDDFPLPFPFMGTKVEVKQ